MQMSVLFLFFVSVLTGVAMASEEGDHRYSHFPRQSRGIPVPLVLDNHHAKSAETIPGGNPIHHRTKSFRQLVPLGKPLPTIKEDQEAERRRSLSLSSQPATAFVTIDLNPPVAQTQPPLSPARKPFHFWDFITCAHCDDFEDDDF
ncbi:MAG: hypothetical protein NTX76_04320 [Alphaproteobacteria bacterium]|nr:hypothetical protein [Alphaproteobacteria bacterium]